MKSAATKVFRKLTPNGVEISLDRKSYEIHYPQSIWKQFPEVYRQNFADALAYSLTMHLCMNGHANLTFNFPQPSIEPYLFESMIYSLGETTAVGDDKPPMSSLLKLFYNRHQNISFVGRPRYRRSSHPSHNNKNKAVIPFSFGKDSLLTYALSEELGVEPHPVFFREPKCAIENRHKKNLQKRFENEFDRSVTFFPISAGRLRQTFGNWWGWDMLFTQYTLLLIPYLYSLRARYLFWAHEQDCNDVFEDSEGFNVNPVFEQSRRWVLTSNHLARDLGSNSVIASIIEPIHEIATTWILHHRYPKYAKYQFSCFAELPQKANQRWCGYCDKCVIAYSFFIALGIDPRSVGLKENLFSNDRRKLYFLFDDNSSAIDTRKRSDPWRDEQLLAFLMAYQKGAKGELIDEFKQKYLKEAETREKELREEFFGVHSTDTLTYELKTSLLKIYQEELAPLQK